MVKDIINLVEGYKNLYFMDYCLSNNREDLLRDVYPANWVETLKQLKYYIKYQMLDYILYTDIGKVIEGEGPLIDTPHNINMEAYVRGLYERNTLIWKGEPVEDTFEFLRGKQVLDFGCGGGFYTELFRNKLGCKVLPYDRADVANQVKIWGIDLEVKSWDFEYLLTTMVNWDVIWMSEVLHGKAKEDRVKLLKAITRNMRDDALLVINELLPCTDISRLFHWQMKLHCKGELITTRVLLEDIEDLHMKHIETRLSRYHEIHILRRD